MKRFHVLTQPVLAQQVQQLNSVLGREVWFLRNKGDETFLSCELKFRSFPATWQFLNMVTLPVNNLRHHPTITTTYNRVAFDITTHDVGNKITSLDLSLATAINLEYLRMRKERNERVPEPATLADASKIVNELVEKQSRPNRAPNQAPNRAERGEESEGRS